MATGVVKTFESSYTRYVTNIGNVSLYMQLKMTQTYDAGTGKSSLVFSDFKLKQAGVVNNTTYVMGEIKVTVNDTDYQIFYDDDAAASAPMYRVAINTSDFSTVQFASGDNSGSNWTYTLSDLAHAADGSLSVTVEWTDITVANYLNGYKVKISGNDTVALTANPVSFALTINAGTGSAITVNRTSSSVGSTGTIGNGTTIYTGDVLEITFAAETGYDLETHTVNGSTFTSGNTLTVSAAVTVAATATVKVYELSIVADEHFTVTVNRTASPLMGAATGVVTAGIFHGDILEIITVIADGYSAEVQTINGNTFVPGDSHTVTGNVTIIVVAESSGTANIGGALYQIGISTDGVFDLYVAYVAKDGIFEILS